MSEKPPTTVLLAGKTYPLSWGDLARVRFSSVPQEIRDLQGPGADALMIWCCIAIKPNPFLTWEHVAETFNKDNIDSVRKVLEEIFPVSTEEKKSGSESEPLTASV